MRHSTASAMFSTWHGMWSLMKTRISRPCSFPSSLNDFKDPENQLLSKTWFIVNTFVIRNSITHSLTHSHFLELLRKGNINLEKVSQNLPNLGTFHERMYQFSKSSCSKVFCKKGVLGNFTRFTGKHLCQNLFFKLVAGPRPATLLKKVPWHRCFPAYFVKFLRTPFLQSTFGGCFQFRETLKPKINSGKKQNVNLVFSIIICIQYM